jgi:hypothetical protein
MKRFILSLPEELFLALQRRAQDRGVSAAAVVRDAIQKEVAPPQPFPKGIGIGRSGLPNLGRLASEEPARYDSSRYPPCP